MKFSIKITRPKFALDRQTVLCLYVPGLTDKSLNMLQFCRNDQRKGKKKRKKNKMSFQLRSPCYGIRFQFTNCTVWPLYGRALFFWYACFDNNYSSNSGSFIVHEKVKIDRFFGDFFGQLYQIKLHQIASKFC